MKRLVAMLLVCCLIPAFVPAGAAADTTTITVAASDSSASAKAQAQYVCDGVNDHAEIQAALNALPSGGTVLLMEGTFVCAGDVMPGASTTLKGQGPDTTILKFPGAGGLKIRSEYVTFADFKVTGTADLHITESHARIQNVTMTVDNSRTGAFYVWSYNDVVEDIEFVNCKAIDCGRYGFLNSGAGSPRLIKNIRYINCEAINCGRDSYVRTGPWVAGFDIVEKNDIQDCQVIGCRAEGNQESGFHLEGFDYLNIENVTFRDCVSINNAQKGKDKCMFGAGFTLPKGCILENCTAENNKRGYFIAGGSVSKAHHVTLTNCSDRGSDFGFWLSHAYSCTLTDCESQDAQKQSVVMSKVWQIKTEDLKMIGGAGAPVHAGSPTLVGAKFASTTAKDDPFANNMWNGPVTDSELDIHAERCGSGTVLCFENAQRVNVTGTIATDGPNPVTIASSVDVDTTGLEITGPSVLPGATVEQAASTPA